MRLSKGNRSPRIILSKGHRKGGIFFNGMLKLKVYGEPAYGVQLSWFPRGKQHPCSVLRPEKVRDSDWARLL